MKIGIVSDTHGNIEQLESVVEWMIRKHRISALYHLGDDYDDVKVLAEHYLEIAQVPGLYDERYKNKSLPDKLFETVLGLTIVLVHFAKDLTHDDISRADIVISGHTHKQELRLADGKLFMNTGHLKGPLDKNMPPTFGLLAIQEREVSAAIYSADFKVVHALEMVRSETGLYKT